MVTVDGGPARHSRRRRLLGWAMLTAGIVIIGGGAWVGWRSYQAYQHLQEASAEVTVLQSQLADITTVHASDTAGTVQQLQEAAGAARSAVDDPIYAMAAAIPVIGPNLEAVRSVAETVDSLAREVMPSLVEVTQAIDPAELAPKDGKIDLLPIARVAPLLQSANSAVDLAIQRVGALDRSAVIGPVADAVTALGQKLQDAADVTAPAARIARLLPPMLGATAPRTYLVVFQNPAELRATGGIFGSYALIRADHGSISMVDHGPSRNLGVFDPPAGHVPANETALYSERMARFPADVNFTPDFPTAARLYLDMYRQRTGTTVDGVLAVDPVALSYALKGAPPIDVGDGVTITADNIVSVLLSTVYQQFGGSDPAARDAFLAKASSTVFSKMMSGAGVPSSVFQGLRRAANERRLLLYSADPAEQAEISRTSLAGTLSNDPALTSIGVFFNDGTEAKLGYYLSSEVHVTDAGCQGDGRRLLTVRVVLHDNAPATGLPSYVVGPASAARPYVLQTNVLIFAPVGGGIIQTATRDGAATGFGRGEDLSREVAVATVALTPGTSTQLEFTVIAPDVPGSDHSDITPQLVLTPGVQPWVTSVQPYRSCAGASRP